MSVYFRKSINTNLISKILTHSENVSNNSQITLQGVKIRILCFF